MIADAAQAANDNSAAGATATPSVEHFNESASQQIEGSSMPIISEPTETANPNLGQASHTVSATFTGQPRIWSFTDRRDGQRMTVTCLPGCQANHEMDQDKPIHPTDAWCQIPSGDVYVPINTGTVEEFRFLSVTLNRIPFSDRYARRLPHATVEVIDDHFIEDLDPDALQQVIDTVKGRVTQMETAHAQLVELRAAAMGRKTVRPAPGTHGPAVSLTAPGAQGAVLNAELHTTDDPDHPETRIAVWAEPAADAELDVAGADQLLADLEKLTARIRGLRNRLAAIKEAQ